MREKEFKIMQEDLRHHKEMHEHYRARCDVQQKTIEYLRNQIKKKNRVCEAKKVGMLFIATLGPLSGATNDDF